MKAKVEFIKLDDNAIVPEYKTKGAAGADIFSNESVSIHPRSWKLIKTGLRIKVPDGFEAQVRPRSGLALINGVTVLNSPGTIDSDYTGELGVILMNHSEYYVEIQHGDRIAQLVISPVVRAEFSIVDSFEPTERGDGGFGSTGNK